VIVLEGQVGDGEGGGGGLRCVLANDNEKGNLQLGWAVSGDNVGGIVGRDAGVSGTLPAEVALVAGRENGTHVLPKNQIGGNKQAAIANEGIIVASLVEEGILIRGDLGEWAIGVLGGVNVYGAKTLLPIMSVAKKYLF
jgi:hypothetical protein